MIGNKYRYLILDSSYVITRNLFAISKGKEIGEYTEGDVMRMTIWTLNKLARDYGITADKILMVGDKWDPDLGGYYTTYLLKGKYKSDRVYINEDVVEQMRNDPNVTPEELHEAEIKLYQNQVKYKSKWGMVRDFKNIGIPSFFVSGWEFDNLAWLASCMLCDSNKKSVIVTKDSDLQYALSPMMDYFRIPTGGSDPVIITYDEMYNTIPKSLRDRGISLYQYKAYSDSLGFGHNAMTSTRKSGCTDSEEIINKILDGDYSMVEDIETFEKQMTTFDISKFPRLEEAKKIVAEEFSTVGKIGSLNDFHDICNKYNITGVSDRYYSDFSNRFDPKLFTEK